MMLKSYVNIILRFDKKNNRFVNVNYYIYFVNRLKQSHNQIFDDSSILFYLNVFTGYFINIY